MSLLPIVRSLGGDLYDCGRRANIPGPGHSRADRSVSLLLEGGRVVVHSFGRSTWRDVLDELRRRGLVDAAGRPASTSAAPSDAAGWSAPARLSGQERARVAVALWDEAAPLQRQLSLRHLQRRRIRRPAPVSPALRHHAGASAAIYAGGGFRRPALLAAIRDVEGALCAVEVTYLDPNGERASRMRTSRKVVGLMPSGCAVRLDPAADELLVGEGVVTTLSASRRFGLPGWALLSTRNLRTWRPPEGVKAVLVAADRGADGERSADVLAARLRAGGIRVRVEAPPPPAGDWNETEESGRRGEGGTKCAGPGGGLPVGAGASS